jgi:hypothetical protein
VTARACPRRGCFRVVPRLFCVRISIGLEDREPEWCCDECLAEIRARAAADPAVLVSEIPSRILAD